MSRPAASHPSAIAPRWAGYTAALFAGHYAISKVVMASREQLGVPGHPAPPEAYERFTGDIATAQLGNAALGIVSVIVALALVQRWGRRIPPLVLAFATSASLVASVAGAVVVGASLTGLREDHGQWGADSLVLGLVPLGAWFVLSACAVRAARGHGPAWAALRTRAGAVVRAATAPGHRAALAAAVGCAGYGLLKLHWALGGELLLRETPLPADALRAMVDREPAAVASHWVSVALAAIGIALAVATVRGARRLPRALIVGLPGLLGVLMLLRAGWGATSDIAVLSGVGDGSQRTASWDLGLWSPFFAAWGVAWSLAARAAHRVAIPRGPRPRPRLVRRGQATVAWGLRFGARGSRRDAR